MDTIRKIIRETLVNELTRSERASKETSYDAQILNLQKQITSLQKAKEQTSKLPVVGETKQYADNKPKTSGEYRTLLQANSGKSIKIVDSHDKIYYLNLAISKKQSVEKDPDNLLVQTDINTRSDVAPGVTKLKISDIKTIKVVPQMFTESTDPGDERRDEAVKLITKQEELRKLRDSGSYFKLPLTKFAVVVKSRYDIKLLSVVDILKILEKIKIR